MTRPLYSPHPVYSTTPIHERLNTAFNRVSCFPEQRGAQGFSDLLTLRNLVPEAVIELQRLSRLEARLQQLQSFVTDLSKQTLSAEMSDEEFACGCTTWKLRNNLNIMKARDLIRSPPP
jgi:hypothetical protein